MSNTMLEAVTAAFATTGSVQIAARNNPLPLDTAECAYLVESGFIDLFLVETHPERPEGARHFLYRNTAGHMLFSLQAQAGFRLLAVPGKDTHIRTLTSSDVANAPPAISEAVLEASLQALGQSLASWSTREPVIGLPASGSVIVEHPTTVGPAKGLVWVKGQPAGSIRILDMDDSPDAGLHPIPEGMWAQVAQACELACYPTSQILEDHQVWPQFYRCLESGYRFVHACIAERERADDTRLTSKLVNDAALQMQNLHVLSSALHTEAEQVQPPANPADPLFGVFQTIGAALDITFVPSPAWHAHSGVTEKIRAICKASSVGYRQVMLRHEWWLTDVSAMLCLRVSDTNETDVLAILPEGNGHYVLFDPVANSRTRIDSTVQSQLEPLAYTFYRPLPHRVLSFKDLLAYTARDMRKDFRVVLKMVLAGFLLGLFIPVMTGFLFDSVIPNASRSQLSQMFAGLMVATLSAALFELNRSIAILRMETKANASLQMAVFDRMIKLPLKFFRQFTSGDLADRANGINVLRQTLGGATLGVLMSSTVSLGNFLLLFYYNSFLALVASGILVINILFTGLLGYYTMGHFRRMQDISGRLSGLVMQFLSGIAKLKVAGAEQRAFSIWASQFAQMKQSAYRAGRLENRQQVFNSMLPVVSSLLIFYLIMHQFEQDPEDLMSIGDFTAFNSAFGIFLVATTTLTSTLINVLNVFHLVERARPILETLPEVDPSKPDPGELKGKVEVRDVYFRYEENGPLILNKLSFHAEPGEFIAFVGPSGAGKSTLLRLLLGFDIPESGTVNYDLRDVAYLDIAAVRQQQGIVLQSSKLASGSVFENIAGLSGGVTMDQVWEAVRLAGMEEDIKAMPMGIHTRVSEGGGTLSGGQRQRLLIARALVSKPRITLFDEATSALDNRTQKIVSDSLGSMKTTRIVIAHRLSTVEKADRIYVLEKGRVVEQGTYQSLIEQDGLFASMARRQLA